MMLNLLARRSARCHVPYSSYRRAFSSIPSPTSRLSYTARAPAGSPAYHTTNKSGGLRALTCVSARHAYVCRSWLNAGGCTRMPLSTSAFRNAAARGARPLAPPPNSYLRMGSKMGLLSVLGLSSLAYYFLYMKPILDEEDATILEVGEGYPSVPEPSTEFAHPLDQESWLYRAWFKVKRTLFLAMVFAPLAAASIVMKLTDGNPQWRQYFLDTMVEAFNSAGCSFQKFGQWLSMRPDMFPPDVIEALSKLQAETPSHSIQHTRKMIKESFGKDLEELFVEFDEEPVASGTVGQVHRARLYPKDGEKGLGKEVAVKVRHPHVLESTWLDIDLIYDFADSTSIVSFPFDRNEFLSNLQRQINFEWEAYNLSIFARNFKEEIKSGQLVFPKVERGLFSDSVMVETWLPGETGASIFSQVGLFFQECKDAPKKFTNVVQKKKKVLAQTVFDMSIKMFLRDNLIHGDLHGGNILFNEEDDTCAILDAGLTTSLGTDIRPRFNQFLMDLVTSNVDKVGEHCLAFQSQRSEAFPKEKEEALKADLAAVVREFVSEDLKAPDGGAVQLGDCCGKLFFTFQEHGLQLRGDVASSIMTLSLSEGLIRSLDPSFDIVKSSMPYFGRYGISHSIPSDTA